MKKLLLVFGLVPTLTLLSGCAGVEVGNPNSPAAVRMRAGIERFGRSVDQLAGEVVQAYAYGYGYAAGSHGSYNGSPQSEEHAALERLERHARNEAIWNGEWPYYP